MSDEDEGDERDDDDREVPRTIFYVFDNEDIILEFNHKGKMTARYLHGPGIDEPLAIERKGEIFFYHADGLGSITALTDRRGRIVQRYNYDSFGNLKRHGHKVKQPYTFTGREWDREIELYYYRARYYDAEVGRFLQEDPILHRGDPRIPYAVPSLLPNPPSLHPYVYVGNNAINLTDPEGLVTPAIAAVGACLANPSCAAALGAAAAATGFAVGKLIETVGQPDQPEQFCPPPSDPGNFVRFCIGKCLSQHRANPNVIRLTVCIIGCIASAF